MGVSRSNGSWGQSYLPLRSPELDQTPRPAVSHPWILWQTLTGLTTLIKIHSPPYLWVRDLKAHLSPAAHRTGAHSLDHPASHPQGEALMAALRVFLHKHAILWVADTIPQGHKGGDVHCPQPQLCTLGLLRNLESGGSRLAFCQKSHLPGSCYKGHSCSGLKGTPEAL